MSLFIQYPLDKHLGWNFLNFSLLAIAGGVQGVTYGSMLSNGLLLEVLTDHLAPAIEPGISVCKKLALVPYASPCLKIGLFLIFSYHTNALIIISYRYCGLYMQGCLGGISLKGRYG